MNEEEFWEIAASSRQATSSLEDQITTLRAQLAGLSPSQLLEFRYHWDRMRGRAFYWPLWDAAELLLGGIDDDTFMDFRAWLISLGRETFEAVLYGDDGTISTGSYLFIRISGTCWRKD